MQREYSTRSQSNVKMHAIAETQVQYYVQKLRISVKTCRRKLNRTNSGMCNWTTVWLVFDGWQIKGVEIL